MLLPELFRSIESHADAIVDGLIADLRRNPRTSYLHGLSEQEFRARARDLYSNLSRWISEGREEDIQRSYSELGKSRRREGVRASELVWALTLAKAHLWDYVRRTDVVESSVELYQEGQLHDMIDRFFDRAVYYALRGHESVAATAQPVRL
jgi:hypothetical protein